MEPHPIPTPTFSRPLLDFTKALRLHQCSLLDHMPAFEILDKAAKALEAIQNAYELMPSSEAGKWFLLSTYESASRNIPGKCVRLKTEIDRIRPSLAKEHQHSETEILDKTLECLAQLLDEAANDLSLLSRPVVIPTTEPPSMPWLSPVEVFQSIEA